MNYLGIIVYIISIAFGNEIFMTIKRGPWQPILHITSCCLIGPMLTGLLGYLSLYALPISFISVVTILLFEITIIIFGIFRRGYIKIKFESLEASPIFHLSLFISGIFSFIFITSVYRHYPNEILQINSKQFLNNLAFIKSIQFGVNTNHRQSLERLFPFANPINEGSIYLKPTLPSIFFAMCGFEQTNISFLVLFVNTISVCAFTYFLSSRYLHSPSVWVPIIVTLHALPLILQSTTAAFSIPMGILALGFITLSDIARELYLLGGIVALLIPSPAVSSAVCLIASRARKNGSDLAFLPYWLSLIPKLITSFKMVPIWRPLQNDGILCAEIVWLVKTLGPLVLSFFWVSKIQCAEYLLSCVPFLVIQLGGDRFETVIVIATVAIPILLIVLSTGLQYNLMKSTPSPQLHSALFFLTNLVFVLCIWHFFPDMTYTPAFDRQDIAASARIMSTVSPFEAVRTAARVSPLLLTGRSIEHSEPPLFGIIQKTNNPILSYLLPAKLRAKAKYALLFNHHRNSTAQDKWILTKLD